MDNLYVICVLYNKLITDIKSFSVVIRLLENYNNVKLIVMDNSESTIQVQNESIYKRQYTQRFHYINDEGNIGLSKAYNRAIMNIQEPNYWVMTIDDDTDFSYDYLVNVNNLIKDKSFTNKIISGVVTNNGSAMSPMYKLVIHNNSSNFINEAGVYENVYCINSGLTIHSDILKTIGGYEESLFLDMLDHWLMEKLIELRLNTITIVDGEILQRFSATVKSTRKQKLKRFRIYKKDFMQFCKLTNKSISFKVTTLLKRYVRVLLNF